MRLAIFLILSITSFSTFAQNYSFTPPVRLSKNVNSISEESLPLVSPDGARLFFVRSLYRGNTGGKDGGQDIWMSTRESDGGWSYATNDFPSLNNERNNAVIGFDTTGTTLYLLEAYTPASLKLNGIAKTVNRNGRYLDPITIKLNGLSAENSFVGFHMDETEDVLLVSMKSDNSIGEEDLYIYLKDEQGDWGTPINLGPTINTEGYEISPYLSKDKKTLFFASSGHDGFGGCDIFMSTRQYNNSWVLWSKPINLGDQINSDGFDAYFSVTDDNEVFFVSNRNSENTDIYSSRMIEEHEEEMRAEINPSKYKLSETEIQSLLGMPVSRTIYFDFGSFELTKESKELINFLAEKLKSNRQYFVELVGHTDIEGSEEFNLQLSRRRAEAVERILLDAGISAGRIATKGVGEKELLYEEGTEEQLAKNRRVEIFFTEDRY